MNDKELYEIAGFPHYRVDKDGRVVSYHIHKDGYYLKGYTLQGGVRGYNLSENGMTTFFSTNQLKGIVEREKLRQPADSMKEGKMQTGHYIIGSIHKTTGFFSASAVPATHTNLAAARKEAERLSNLDKQKQFVVLEVKGIAAVQEVVWR